MEEIDKNKIDSKRFISTVCGICGICDGKKSLRPDFCEALYETSPSQFIDNMIHKVCLLRESDREKYRKLETFEGFCALFCHEERCPIFDAECKVNLSKKVSCYEIFLYQSSIQPSLKETSRIYSIWSGVDPSFIGKSFGLFSSPAHVPKKKRRQIVKVLKKIKKTLATGQREYHGHRRYSRKKNRREKLTSTLFFYNNSLEWEGKLSSYLDGADNQRQSEAAGHTG